MRNPRNVNSVIGCELNLQLSDPACGSAFSIVARSVPRDPRVVCSVGKLGYRRVVSHLDCKVAVFGWVVSCACSGGGSSYPRWCLRVATSDVELRSRLLT